MGKKIIIYLKKVRWGEWVILNPHHTEIHKFYNTYEVEDAKEKVRHFMSSFNIPFQTVIIET